MSHGPWSLSTFSRKGSASARRRPMSTKKCTWCVEKRLLVHCLEFAGLELWTLLLAPETLTQTGQPQPTRARGYREAARMGLSCNQHVANCNSATKTCQPHAENHVELQEQCFHLNWLWAGVGGITIATRADLGSHGFSKPSSWTSSYAPAKKS